jgi:hypothetical protein
MPRATVRARVSRAKATASYVHRARRGRGERASLWGRGEFVAIDGEGFSEGAERDVMLPSGAVYRDRKHYYAYLSASDGHEIYNPDGRLSIGEALDFICEIKARNSKAVVVIFGGSYDVTHIFTYALTREQILELTGKHLLRRALDIEIDQWTYRIDYRPRKCLTIRRWARGHDRYKVNKRGQRVMTPHLSVQVWDVWGFFQDSFVGVLEKWLPDDADYEMIKTRKGERNIFDRREIEDIKVYNAAELRCLVRVMEKVKSAIADLDLKITRWDGAGAIAAAMMKHHRVKDHMRQPPPEVFDAARIAYSGGHIEVCKMGYHNGQVHHYDVNSSYPNEFRTLPSLADGEWKHGKGNPPPGFTIVRLSYSFARGREFYPLFFRAKDGSILYPRHGCGWYWMPEFETAQKYHEKFGGILDVLEWWHFDSRIDTRPFAWVEDYYAARQRYIERARAKGEESGPEKIIKLGLNSIYGKTAQQVGARYDRDGDLKLPSYFQLEWAGYVTSGCRAKLMEAAIEKPHAIIGFATDGLFSVEPLNLYTPERKELGAWEYRIHDGITMVMPGVYWLHDGEAVKNYSRGFDRQEMSDALFVHDYWRRKQTIAPIKVTRLIGLGTACTSKYFWEMRGDFVTSRRALCLDGHNAKRYSVNLNRCRPHLELVNTTPREHRGYADDEIPVSAPYPIAWLDGDLSRDDPDGEWAEDRDASDADLA